MHGVQVVVLYLNCLDILTRLDFDYLESSLSEATGVMVRYFFRGPLGKMDIRHFKPVYEFMAELPEENGCISHNLYQLPPLATDVAGVIDTLPANEAKVLVAPAAAGLVCAMAIYWSKRREYMFWKQKSRILFMV